MPATKSTVRRIWKALGPGLTTGAPRRRPEWHRNLFAGGCAIRFFAGLDYVAYAAFHGRDPDH
jgi:hypothetical protein